MKRFAPFIALAALAIAWWLGAGRSHADVDSTDRDRNARAPRVRTALRPDLARPSLAADELADPRGELWLEGRVVDRYGDGVAGALVHIDARPPILLTTDESGIFEVDGLLPTRYRLTARSGTEIARGVAVDLTPETDPVTLVLARASLLHVRVVDIDSSATVEGATVEVADVPMLVSKTGRDGIADLAGVDGGHHFMRVTHPEYAPTVRPFDLPDDPRTLELAIALDHGGEVTGVVLGPDGTALADAAVRVSAPGFESQTQWLEPATTDERGQFAFPRLARGKYDFVASARGYSDAASELVEVRLGDAIELPALTLGEGNFVGGNVVDENDSGVGGALIRVTLAGTGQSATRQWQVYTEPDGSFTLEGMPARELELVAMHGTRRSESMAIDLASSPQSAADLRVELAVDGFIRGTVVDGEEEPIANARVIATPSIEGRLGSAASARMLGDLETTTDAEGRFQLTALRPGRYVVRAAPPGRSREGALQQPGTAVVTGTEDAQIVSSRGGMIRGRVVDADGRDVRSLRVKVDTAPSRARGIKRGRFAARVEAAGTHVVTLEAPGFATHTIEDVEVGEAQKVDLGTIVLDEGERLDGIVVDAEGRPVSGARVAAGFQVVGRSTTIGRAVTQAGELSLGEATTDGTGHFSITGLDRSHGAVVAEHEAYGKSRAVSLPVASDGVLELVLRGPGSVDGRVVRDGAPVSGATVEAVSGSAARARVLAGTDSEGRFHFEALAEGPWTIRGSESKRSTSASSTSQAITVVSGGAHEVELDLGGGDAVVEVSLGPQRADVTFAQVQLVPGSVSASTAGDLEAHLGASAGHSFSDVVFGRVAATFEGVPEGPWSVCATFVTIDTDDPRQVRSLQLEAERLPVECQSLEVSGSHHAVTL